MNTSQKINAFKVDVERTDINILLCEILNDMDRRLTALEERHHD